MVGSFFSFFSFVLRVLARFVQDSFFLAFDVLGLVLAPIERQLNHRLPNSELGPQFGELKIPSWAKGLERQKGGGEDYFALLGLIRY